MEEKINVAQDFYAQTSRSCRGMSYNLTQNSAHELRDDLYQEGMLRVFLERPHWAAAHADGASEIAFCLHKARYAMLDYLRRHGPIARSQRRGADYQVVSLN